MHGKKEAEALFTYKIGTCSLEPYGLDFKIFLELIFDGQAGARLEVERGDLSYSLSALDNS